MKLSILLGTFLVVVIATAILSYQEGHYFGMTEFCNDTIVQSPEGYICMTYDEIEKLRPKQYIPEYNFSEVDFNGD